MSVRISAIVAMAQNRVIGKGNDLPWHIPGDLKHYKKTTLGKPLVMGRKCFESLGKPLPGRANIVVSRSALPSSQDVNETTSLHYVGSIEDGIKLAQDIATARGVDEIFINGGGEIYKQALPITQRLYLTLIHRDYEGDVFFPDFDRAAWKELAREDHLENDPPYTILTLAAAGHPPF